MKRTKGFFLSAAVLAVLTALLVIAARLWPQGFYPYYTPTARFLMKCLAAVTSVLPFALWEVALWAIPVVVLGSLGFAICKKRWLLWLSSWTLILCAGCFAFVFLWGLNYFAPSMATRLGLEPTQYTPAQLRVVTEYFRDLADADADKVQRDAEGWMTVDFDDAAKHAAEGYAALEGRVPEFSSTVSSIKHLIGEKYMMATGTTGIFICLTGESAVCDSTYPAAIPFTMCHELGHRMGFARENEANFAAYLTCMENSDVQFRYSAAFQCLIYCYNALYKVDPDTAREVISRTSKQVLEDISNASVHYDRVIDRKAEEASDKVYNTYLKTFSVNNGTQSYGEVVDLLAMWYYQRICS